LKPEWLEILACPRCKGALAWRGDTLHCGACALSFAVENGVPDLLLPVEPPPAPGS
jgi:uncharacterized protein YbaR (Trm112 family)